jgi:hypothetical protein
MAACCAQAVLDNIVYCRCYTHEQQMERVMQIPDVVVDDASPFRVVVRAAHRAGGGGGGWGMLGRGGGGI